MKNMVYHFLLFINNVNQGKTLLLQRMMLENMCFCLKKSEWDNEMPVGSATIPPPSELFCLAIACQPS